MQREALVTGANRGIGLEWVRQLAARGDRVTATCRQPERAPELLGLAAQVVPLDVTDAAGVAELAAHEADRPLDLLINNAGIGVGRSRLGDIDYADMEIFFRINAVAPLRISEALMPRLRNSVAGVIANMTSRMGSIEDNTSGGSYAYRASKAALNMVTRSLALDAAGDGIRVVALHPGWVQTDMGGADARTPVDESVAGLLGVLDALQEDQSGGFYDFTGKRLPW